MNLREKFETMGGRLECTCGACPEQYDVFMDGEQIGYIRLRHGQLTASYPDVGGTVVYHHSFDNDRGCFLNTAEASWFIDRCLVELLTAVIMGVGLPYRG